MYSKRLQRREQVGAVDHLHAARHRADGGVLEVADRAAQRLRVERGITVHAQDDLARGLGDSGVESARLAAVRFGDDAHVGSAMFPGVDRSLHGGVVLRAVVDHQDLVARIVEVEQRADRSLITAPSL
jgi:hypothetical protein